MHKKYIKRGKKVFGPYYYQNYRVGGITKTRYLGRAPSDIKKNLLFNKNIFIVLGIAVLICLFAFSYPLFFRGLTGKVSLELSDSYEIGEQIKGNLNLNLKKGELIPADSILKISLGEQELEISISELIGLEQEVGDFYAEGSEISGRGGGFGFTGEKKVYPEISFKLLVNSVSEKEKEQEKEQKKERKIEEKNETEQVENITEIIEINETEQIENITEITELNETEIIEINETIAEINETEQSEEITENITQEQEITGTINETIEEDKKEDKKEEKETKETKEQEKEDKKEEKETKETKEQEKEDKKEEKETEKEKLKITGEAVKQTTYLVDGVVTMQEPFVYGLEEEDFASIVSNSVKLYDASADADLLSLVVKDNKAEVTTDFYEIREGFGKDYALDETETITISLDNFNLTAEQGIIKLSLEYETLGIVEISKEINVDGDSHPPTQNQTEIIENITIPLTQNQTEIIENITEIPELNETLIEINETIANITEEIMQNYSVSTLQYKSIIDKPVKWKKIINKLSDENITLILPKETLNVSIKEISEEQEVQTSVLTGQVIGGNIVMNLEIQEQSFITRLYNSFLNSLRTITGLVISGQEDFVSVLIEGKSTDYEVEYYTRAPEVFEEKISEIKKKITISGPDVLHYQDILAYTKLPANISAENANAIKLYWIKSLSEVQEIDANLLALNETQEVSAYQPTLNQSEINETETPEVVNETEVNETIIDKQVSLLTGNVISEQEISETETINNIVQEAGEIQNLTQEDIENITGRIKDTNLEASEDKIEIDFEILDENNDGIVDYILWRVPYLSNQSYELEISVINVQSYPTVGGNWSVMFNTTGTGNLTITAINSTTWTNYSEQNYDLKFLEIKCGGDILEYSFLEDNCSISGNCSVFIEDYNCDETGYETSKVITSGKHELEFDFNGFKAYAFNFASGDCSSGDLTTTCYIDYQYNVTEGEVISANNLIIESTGSLFGQNISFGIDLTGNLTVLGTINTSAFCSTANTNYRDGGNISIIADIVNISGGIYSCGGNPNGGDGFGGDGGVINISANEVYVYSEISATGGASIANSYADGGSGGLLTINASIINITGNINMSGGRGGGWGVSSGGSNNGDGGIINLTAINISMSNSNIYSLRGSQGQAKNGFSGTAYFNATDNLDLNNITIFISDNFGNLSGSAMITGKGIDIAGDIYAPGAVLLIDTAKNITLGTNNVINLTGEFCTSGTYYPKCQPGGNITFIGGSVNLSGKIYLSGGKPEASGRGGDGGAINITAINDISLSNEIIAIKGQGGVATNGYGGGVYIDAGRKLIITDATIKVAENAEVLNATGNSFIFGTGIDIEGTFNAQGVNLWIDTSGNITIESTDFLNLSGSKCDPGIYDMPCSFGGNLTLVADVVNFSGIVDVSGGDIIANQKGFGGVGGSVNISANEIYIPGNLLLRGGDVPSATYANGGHAGVCMINATIINITGILNGTGGAGGTWGCVGNLEDINAQGHIGNGSMMSITGNSISISGEVYAPKGSRGSCSDGNNGITGIIHDSCSYDTASAVFIPTETYTFGGSSIPIVTLNYPENWQNLSRAFSLNCTATYGSCTSSLKNITLYDNSSGTWDAIETKSVSGTTNTSSFSKTFSNGVYIWNCLVYDNETNSAFASDNFTFGFESLNLINFKFPTPNNATTISNTSFEVNVSITKPNLEEVIWNFNGNNYSIFNESLFLMLNFDNISSIGENDTYVVDVSGYGRNGTIVNNAIYNITGRHGYGIEFNAGSSDYIEIPNIVLPTYMSVAVWVRFADSNSKMIIAADDEVSHPANRQHFLGSISSDPTKIRWVIFNTAQQWTNQAGRILVDPSAYSTNTWYYYVGTWDGANAKLYRNGVQVASVPFTGTLQSTTATTRIGGNVQEESKILYTNGTIDEVRIWNRSLSADEVNQFYMMNLNKYDSENWSLWINQSQNSTEGLADGTYEYYASAKDEIGNENSTEVRVITINTDSAAPIMTILSPENLTYNLNVSELNYTFTETNKDSCWYSINNGNANLTAVSMGNNFTNVESVEGSNNWTLWCNDTANNEGIASVVFVKDTIVPDVEFSGQTPTNASGVLDNSIFINVTSSDNLGEHSIVVDWNNSLVGWWRFDDRNATGDPIDKSIYGNNGVAVGALYNSSGGKYGGAYMFDGADDIINLGNSATLRPATFTISAWVYLKSGTGSETNFVTRWDSAGGVNQRCYNFGKFSTDKLQFRISDSGSGDGHVAYSTDSLSLNTWIYVTGVYDGANILTYINGNADGTPVAHTGVYASTNPTVIGAIAGRVGTDPIVTDFNGTIDDVKIYSRVLSGQEINASYNANLYQYYNNFTSLNNGDDYSVKAYAQDIAGNLNNTNTRIISIDTTAPIMTILYPSNTTYSLNVSELNYTFTETNKGSCWYSIDNGDTNSSIVDTEVNFTDVESVEGSNNWTLWCNDTANNEGIASVVFVKDSAMPALSLDYPTNTTYNHQIVELNYTFTETNCNSVWYSTDKGDTNSSIETTCGNNFTGLASAEGSNNWTLWLNDSAGNEQTNSVVFATDSVYPQLNITFPINGSTILYSGVEINYTFTEINCDSIWWTNNSGITNHTLTNCGDNITGENWESGLIRIDIYINDTSGKINNTEFVEFNVDTSPIVYLISLANGSISNMPNEWFVGNFTSEVGLKNATLYVWNITGFEGSNDYLDGYEVAYDNNITGVYNQSNLSINFSLDGDYLWNYYVCDINENCAWNSTNWTLTIKRLPVVNWINIVLPISNISSKGVYISTNITDIGGGNPITEVNFTVIAPNNSLVLDNSSNVSFDSSMIWNSTTFNTDDEGLWKVNVTYDVTGGSVHSESSYFYVNDFPNSNCAYILSSSFMVLGTSASNTNPNWNNGRRMYWRLGNKMVIGASGSVNVYCIDGACSSNAYDPDGQEEGGYISGGVLHGLDGSIGSHDLAIGSSFYVNETGNITSSLDNLNPTKLSVDYGVMSFIFDDNIYGDNAGGYNVWAETCIPEDKGVCVFSELADLASPMCTTTGSNIVCNCPNIEVRGSLTGNNNITFNASSPTGFVRFISGIINLTGSPGLHSGDLSIFAYNVTIENDIILVGGKSYTIPDPAQDIEAGGGGDLRIKADYVNISGDIILDGGDSTFSSGSGGGDVEINSTEEVYIDDIITNGQGGLPSQGGEISISAVNITLTGNIDAKGGSATVSSGAIGGNLILNATDTLTTTVNMVFNLSGGNGYGSGVGARGGNVTLSADKFYIHNSFNLTGGTAGGDAGGVGGDGGFAKHYYCSAFSNSSVVYELIGKSENNDGDVYYYRTTPCEWPKMNFFNLNATSGNNYSTDNLTCYATVEDVVLSNLTIHYKWHNGTSLESAGDVVVENDTLTLISTIDSINTTAGEIWNCSGKMGAENWNVSYWNSSLITVGASPVSNTAPYNPVVFVNSTEGNNKTTENLTCYSEISDIDADSMNITVQWYNFTEVIFEIDYNNSYLNGTFFNASLESGNTTKADNWSCGLRLNDGTDSSAWVNSSVLKILNTIPIASLTSPDGGNITTNRTPSFSWTGSDDDSDSLQYEINISCYYSGGGTCHTGDRYVDKSVILTDISYFPTDYLEYLIDNNYYYNWSVRAWDGEDYGDWTAPRNISIQSDIIISLPVNEILFGYMNTSDISDTSDDSPLPLVLQNDGNAVLNISINFTNLFLNTVNPSDNFKFKIRNFSSSCFAIEGTTETWTQAPAITTHAIQELNFTSGYQTGCNNASVDLLVTVPGDEPPGDKGAIITFTSSLGEPGFGAD